MSRYPHHPGAAAGSATSAAAANSMAGAAAESIADWCESWFRHHTENGRLKTCEECEIAAKKVGLLGKHQTISARIRTDLFLKRKSVFKTGFNAKTGEKVKVWSTSPTSGLQKTTAGHLVFETRPTTAGRPAWLYGWGRRA